MVCLGVHGRIDIVWREEGFGRFLLVSSSPVMRCVSGGEHPDWLYRGAQSDGIAFRVFSRLYYHLIAKIKETFSK